MKKQIGKKISVNLSFGEMADLFTQINKNGLGEVSGFIVFSQESFPSQYSETSRTYQISSDNKAFIVEAGGWSIFGSCLDGTDQCLRLDEYICGANHWKIERCYMFREDYDRLSRCDAR